MLKFCATALMSGSMALATTGDASACGGCRCGGAPNYYGAAPGAYRSYSYGAAPTSGAPAVRGFQPSFSNQFRADRKIRGIY